MSRVLRGVSFCFVLIAAMIFAGCNSGSKPISVTIVSPSGAQAIDVGQSFNITVQVNNDKMAKGAMFSISGVGALSNQSATGATYTAPASGAGGNAMITIASATDPTKTIVLNVVVTALPAITNASATLAAGVEGTLYNASVTETGGAGTLTYSISSGTLPAGLNLNSSTGAITGTPTGPNGTANFTVQVKDASTVAPQTATKAFTLTVNLPPAPSISTTSLPADTEGTGYNQTVAVTGGLAPLTYSISSGALPAGLGINSSTGAITGSATGPNGTANFTVKVTDSSNPVQSATQALSILINLPAPPQISTSSLPPDVEGTAYNQAVQATGFGTLVYSISAGALPAGLNINSSTGHISGTPTGPNGASNFTVKVSDGSNPAQSTTQALSITINLPTPPVITTTSLPGVVEFANYNQTVQASGFGTLTYSISVGALPAGLNINSSTGAITGSPTGPNGTVNFTVKVTDGSNPAQSATQALSIAVTLPPAPSITTTSLPNATVGGMYNQSVAFTGGHAPFTWSISAGSLPAGFIINTSTGAITSASVPNSPGTTTFTVKVVDSSNPSQSATQTLSISIVTGPLAVTPANLPHGAISEVYPTTNLGASGGAPPYTWTISAGSLPTGMNPLSPAGQISGTPTASGTFNFTAKVTDSSSATATGNFSITVNSALAITTSSLPNGTVGTPYTSTNLAASGGVTPYTWSISSGSLPNGLMLNGNTISGQPTASGTFNFTATVMDAEGGTANSALSIVVNPAAPLMVTTTSSNLPAGTVNTAYANTQLNASGGIQPYSWAWVAASGSQIPPGLSISTGGLITGTPTLAGTFNIVATVTDSATPTANTANANLSITVNAAVVDPCASAGTGGEALLNGQYVFVLKGFDNGSPQQPALVGGVLKFNGSGGITSGTIDTNLNTGFDTANGGNPLSVTSGTYKIGTSGSADQQRACMSITTSAGTQHYRASLNGAGSLGHMVGFDTAGPYVTGELKKQSASIPTTLSGNFAFGVSSAQNTTACDNATICGGKFGAVGVFDLASGGSVTGGEVDFSHGDGANTFLDGTAFTGGPAGFPASPVSINSGGSYSINATTGRGTFTFTPQGTGNNAVNNVIYVVSSTDVLIMAMDPSASNTTYAGEMLQQSGSLTPSGTYVGGTSRLGSTSGDSRADLLRVALSGGNITSIATYQNDSGTPTVQTGNNVGTYTINSTTGRLLLAITGNNHAPVIYLVSPNEAFQLGSNPEVESGFFQSQTSTAAPSGVAAFGTIDPATSNVSEQDGLATFSSGNVNVTQDSNTLNQQQTGKTQSQTFSVDGTGLGTVPSGCAPATSGSCQFLFYVISSGSAVGIDYGGQSPAVQPLDH